MYICLECHDFFEEPTQCFNPWLEHFGTPCRETYSASPCCAADYEPAKICDHCSEYIDGTYIVTEDKKTYCNNCYLTYEVGE